MKKNNHLHDKYHQPLLVPKITMKKNNHLHDKYHQPLLVPKITMKKNRRTTIFMTSITSHY